MESKEYYLFAIVVASLAATISLALGIFNAIHNYAIRSEARTQKEQAKKSDDRRYGALLSVLAHESVGLFERMVQYTWQAALGDISYSRPFVLLEAGQIVDLVRLGASASLMKAVFAVRETNELVTIAVDRANAILLQVSGEKYVPEAMPRGVPFVIDPARQAAQERFNSAAAFVVGAFEEICASISIILDNAETVGTTESVREDKKRFQALRAKYESLAKPKK
jgi:hypothetical protein